MKIEVSYKQVLSWAWRWFWGTDREAARLSFRGYLWRQRSKYANAKALGVVLKDQATMQRNAEAFCNHRKGGYQNIHTGKFTSMGSEPSDYAVIKHQMADGSWFIRCNRCGKTWKPGIEGYEEAVKFPTRNAASSSIQMRFLKTDNGVTRNDSARYQAAIANS